MSGSARGQLLEVAGRLFFQHGYRAVGIDTILAEAGVAKATLYRHFPSKDDLIAAYLVEMNGRFWAWFEEGVNQHPDAPLEQLLEVFRRLEKLISTPTCLGCPFLMAASEFPAADHPGHQIALENKRAVQARLRQMCADAGLHHPDRVGDQLALMMDGAFMAVRVFGVENPASTIAAQAEATIRAALA